MFSNYIFYSLGFLISLQGIIFASFCGESSVPFSFEILPNGQPVLGCARPSCFGWDADGTPLTNDAQFYRIHKKPDGFLRKQSEEFRRMLNEEDSQYYKPKQAKCTKTYESESCPGEDEWVGGIAPALNYTELPLGIQCCSYAPLKDSEDRGVAVVNVGQIVIGGEVFAGKRQYAFDYIKDILKHTNENGTVYYDVSIRRMSCLPLPDELSIKVDNSVMDEFNDKFVERVNIGQKQEKFHERNIAFQAPTYVPGKQGSINTEAASRAAELVAQELRDQDSITHIKNDIVVDDSKAGSLSSEIQQSSYNGQQGPIQQSTYVAPPAQAGGAPIQQLPGPVNTLYNTAPVQSQYYPVQGYGSSGSPGCCSSFFCFSGDTLVHTIEGKLKPISELEVGKDWVLSRNKTDIVYSQVTEWIHKDDKQEAEFIKISLEDGKELKITSYHYIYKTECTSDKHNEKLRIEDVETKAVYAKDVNVGDCLYTLSEEGKIFVKHEVTSIDIVKEIGIYAPMTGTGDIVVEGILASCENIIHNTAMRSSFYNSFKYFADFIPSLFGTTNDSETVNLPHGLELAIQMMNLIMPKEVFSF
uniref:HintN domain-containing protein n=1 Tax=Parastrongyloides trichosuri TaxID=131310 RepID=A0A0N4ZTM4_PARTI